MATRAEQIVEVTLDGGNVARAEPRERRRLLVIARRTAYHNREQVDEDRGSQTMSARSRELLQNLEQVIDKLDLGPASDDLDVLEDRVGDRGPRFR